MTTFVIRIKEQAAMARTNSSETAKPAKPYPEFPLFPQDEDRHRAALPALA